jgi:hypothetical protein
MQLSLTAHRRSSRNELGELPVGVLDRQVSGLLDCTDAQTHAMQEEDSRQKEVLHSHTCAEGLGGGGRNPRR